jgi:hypothetical protein
MTGDETWDEARGRVADANEIAAVMSWVSAMDPRVVADFGVRAERLGGALALFVPATGTAFFNRVIGLGVTEQASPLLVRRIVREYRRLGTSFMIHLAPYARPAELPLWLAEEGLEHGSDWLVLYRDPAPAAARDRQSPITVTCATTGHAEVFAETLCTGYGMPIEWAPLYRDFVGREPWRHYLAFDGDHAVGTSSLLINRRLVWLGNSATLTGHRKCGVQTTLNGERLRQGLAARCTAFTGETWRPTTGQPNQSLRNHVRDGFETAYVRRNYAWSPFGRRESR